MIIDFKNHFVIVLVGPSGCGKTTISKYLNSKLHIPIHTTYTTRKKKENEVDGKDYFFVTEKFFKENDFLETATYNKNLYGTNKQSFENILNKNFASVIVMEENGAKFLKQHYKNNVITVLLQMNTADNNQLLLKRDTLEYARERIKTNQSTVFNFSIYDYILPVNGTDTNSWDYVKKTLVNLITNKR